MIRKIAAVLALVVASCGPPETPEQAREREAKSHAISLLGDFVGRGSFELREIEFQPETGAVCGLIRMKASDIPLFALRRFAVAEGSGFPIVTRNYSDDTLTEAFVNAGCPPLQRLSHFDRMTGCRRGGAAGD